MNRSPMERPAVPRYVSNSPYRRSKLATIQLIHRASQEVSRQHEQLMMGVRSQHGAFTGMVLELERKAGLTGAVAGGVYFKVPIYGLVPRLRGPFRGVPPPPGARVPLPDLERVWRAGNRPRKGAACLPCACQTPRRESYGFVTD